MRNIVIHARERVFPQRTLVYGIAIVTGLIVGGIVGRVDAQRAIILGGILLFSIFVWVFARRPVIGIYVLLLSVLPGQLLRIPVFNLGGGLLVTDVIAGAMLGALVVRILTLRPLRLPPLFFPLALLLAWMGATLVLAFPGSILQDRIIGASYFVRVAVLFLAIWITVPLLTPVKRQRVLMCGLGVIGLLALSALVQVVVLPDLQFLASYGWDPHIGRAVGSWLDPNFLGAALLFGAVISFALLLRVRTDTSFFRVEVLGGVFLFSLVALALTYSRTSLLAALVGFGVVLFLSRPKILPLVLVVALCTPLVVPGIGARLFDPGTLVPNIEKRLTSWRDAYAVWTAYPLMGVGYNLYAQEREERGARTSLTLHSRAGSDSSFLTLAATTGVIGLALFLSFLSLVAWRVFDARGRAPTPMLRAAAPGILAALLAWLVHAQGVNSLLYIHVMVLGLTFVAIVIPRGVHEHRRIV